MSTASDTMLITYATQYIKDGFVVMPVINYQDTEAKRDNKTKKKPILPNWQKLTLADADMILTAFKRPGVNAIGLLTGKINGVYVLDVDPGADMSSRPVPVTPAVKTGRGYHYYFKYEDGLGNTSNEQEHLDTRGDGGFVVVPPSWHHENTYEWLVELSHADLEVIPQWLRDLVKSSRRPYSNFCLGTQSGNRNHSAAQVIGHVLSKLHEDLWEDFGWHGLRRWNQRNTPPLPEDELYKVFISIASREKRNREAYRENRNREAYGHKK